MPSELPSGERITSRPFRFRLVHLIYIVTLLAISMGAFGPPGIIVGVLFAVLWIVVFNSRSRPRVLGYAGCLLVFLLCCFGFPNSARDAARRMYCSDNLKQIALALHNYHEQYSCFPPAFLPDERGQPKHSWRVLILPFLGHQALYKAYNFSEPWDSPSNRKLLAQRPPEYTCPAHSREAGHDDTCTSYVAVVGPSTAWPGPVGKTLSDFVDPTSRTVLVVDAAGSDIPWTEPRDLVLPQALEQLASTDPEQHGGHHHEDFFVVQFVGRNVAMVDGSVTFLPASISRSNWSQWLVDNDDAKPTYSDDLDRDDLDRHAVLPAKRKLGNYVRLGVWIAVVLFPMPWVWSKRKPTAQTTDASRRDLLPGRW